jgi:hypothetical protein
MPQTYSTHNNPTAATMTKHTKVKHHPIPIPSSIESTTAAPTAPKRHRNRFCAADAVLTLSGKISASSVVRLFIVHINENPIINEITNGTARGAL